MRGFNSFIWDKRITVQELEPPTSLSPYAAAWDAELCVDSVEMSRGRLILLHEPTGNDLWESDFRCVTFARAEMSPEMIHDPLLAEVGWSWLVDALRQAHARFTRESGTITTISSVPFGSKKDEEQIFEMEVRASWTPILDGENHLAPHLDGWQNLLRHLGGTPDPESVVGLKPAVSPV